MINTLENKVESILRRPQGSVPLLAIDYIVVGGGEAGSVNNPADAASYNGGGGGGVVSGSVTLALNQEYSIITGRGGTVGNIGTAESSSLFGNVNGIDVLYAASGAVGTTSGYPGLKVAGASDTAGGGTRYGGGGGGATTNGDNALNPNAGIGGYGVSWFTGSYAGGGGGGVIDLASGTGAAGRDGGGDGGGMVDPSTPGTNFTGGGGGAAGNNNTSIASKGGDGVVIIRYETPAPFGAAYALGGRKYVDPVSGYTYHYFETTGSVQSFHTYAS